MKILSLQCYQIVLPYLACFSAGLFSFYNLFQISVFNVISTNLLSAFHLSSVQLGLFSSVYLLANALWLIPGGLLLDRYPLRKVVLIFSALDILASFVIAQSTLLPLSILMRFIQGLASAMSLLTCTRLATRWFPAQAATVIGSIVAFALLGGIFANTIFAKMALYWGWREAMLLNGSIGIMFFIFMVCFLQDKIISASYTKNINYTISLAQLKNATFNLNNLAHGIYIGLMNLPLFIFATLWGKIYLEQAYKIPAAKASSICALLYAGILLGAPIMGFISDKMNSRKKILIGTSIVMLVCILPLLLNKNLTAMSLAVVFFLIGFFSSSPIVSYAALAESNASDIASTASSIAFFMANLIGMLAQPLFAFLLNSNWYPLYINHVPLYTINDYIGALRIFPVAFIGCLILSLLLKEVKLLKSE